MLTLLVPFAAAHSDALPHVHAEASPLGLVVVTAWVLLAAAWWRSAARVA